MSQRIIIAVILQLSLILVVASLSAPILLLQGHEKAATRIYELADIICHQNPSRSFGMRPVSQGGYTLTLSPTMNGKSLAAFGESTYVSFAVCARDFGIYLGLLLTCVVLMLFQRPKASILQHPIMKHLKSSHSFIFLLAVLVSPMLIDIGLQQWDFIRQSPTVHDSGNLLRSFTGFLFGVAVCLWACFGIGLSAREESHN